MTTTLVKPIVAHQRAGSEGWHVVPDAIHDHLPKLHWKHVEPGVHSSNLWMDVQGQDEDVSSGDAQSMMWPWALVSIVGLSDIAYCSHAFYDVSLFLGLGASACKQ